jgi:hypothetical protein
MEGEELHWDDGEDALEAVDRMRHRDELLHLRLRLRIILVAD